MEPFRLLPHQRVLVRRSRNLSALPLWVDPRVGKSLAALAWALTRPPRGHWLIVAPLAVVPEWSRLLERQGVPHAVVPGRRAARARILAGTGGRGWHVASWEALSVPRPAGKSRKDGGRRRVEASDLAALRWGGVILDESTRIRKPTTDASKVAVRWLGRATYRACLSGCPRPEVVEDFVQQHLFLYGEFMGYRDFYAWRQRHMRRLPWAPKAWEVVPSRVELVYEEVRRLGVIMTKDQAGIGTELLREVRHVVLPAHVLREVKRARQRTQAGNRLGINALQSLLWEEQLAGGRFPGDPAMHHDAKLRELGSMVTRGGIVHGEPLVVWSRFNSLLHAARKVLSTLEISCTLVEGGTKVDQIVERWKAGGSLVLLAQPTCIKMGVDLSRASIAVHLSRYHEHEVNYQADERTEHPTRPRSSPRLCVDIVAAGTREVAKVRLLEDKRRDADAYKRGLDELAR